MDITLQYIISMIPTIIAVAAELGIVKFALKVFAQIKESKEMKAIISQNEILLQELRESKKFNKELLTKIDRIERGE